MNGVTGTWKVRFSLENSNIKIYPVQPETFSTQLVSTVIKSTKQENIQYVGPEEGLGKEYIKMGRADFLCLYFIANYLDFFEFDKDDFADLRERFTTQFNSFYENVFKSFQDKINAEKAKDHKKNGSTLHTVYNLKDFQIDLIKEGVQKKGRFILNEKRIVGKRVIAYQIMKFFQDKSKKIVIIAAKKNTHHWRELICQWDDYVSKKNIILYKKENRLASLLKKQIIIVNDNLIRECLKDAQPLFNKSSNIIIDKDVQYLEEIAESIKDYSLRVCYICQSFSKLKIGEKLALLTLFDCVKKDYFEMFDLKQQDFTGQTPSISDLESVSKSERKLENVLLTNNSIQQYFVSLNEEIEYPEFDFKVHEQAFIINYDDEEIERIKMLKNMVSSGNSEDIINTYKDKFEKNDDDIRGMSKNLKGHFKNPEKYFFNHSLESMKRAIDFYCTKLFAETKINNTKTIIEKLISEGKRKIVIWAFHCNILQKIASFIRELNSGKGYKVLEVTSVMADDKRNEIIMDFNKLDKGFLIIPFSVKKERFKNLDFDVFLFVELTYNLDYYLTARKILYSPYLTKDKYLYIVLSPPADSYIWIKFETLYKRPDWERCIRELKEKKLDYVVQDLVVKDDRSKTMSSDLEQIKIQLEITNEKLKVENKKKLEKIRELKEKKKAHKKVSSYEIDAYINSLVEGQILPKEEERLFNDFSSLNKVRIGKNIYIKSMRQRKDNQVWEAIQNKSFSIDNMDMPEPSKNTLKALRDNDDRGFKSLFSDRLDLLPYIEKRVQLIEDEFDLNEMQSNYNFMVNALGKNNYGNLNNDLYKKTIEALGFEIQMKDPTQSTRMAGMPANQKEQQQDMEEDDTEFYEEFMNMLLSAYMAVAKNRGVDLYYGTQETEKDNKTIECSFEKNVIEAMFDIKNNSSYTRINAIIDRACGNVKINDLIKESFKQNVKSHQDEVKLKYNKIDLADQVARSLRLGGNIKNQENYISLPPLKSKIEPETHEIHVKQELTLDMPSSSFGMNLKQEAGVDDLNACFNLFSENGERKDSNDDLHFEGHLDHEDIFLGKRTDDPDLFESLLDKPYLGQDRELGFDLDQYML